MGLKEFAGDSKHANFSGSSIMQDRKPFFTYSILIFLHNKEKFNINSLAIT